MNAEIDDAQKRQNTPKVKNLLAQLEEFMKGMKSIGSFYSDVKYKLDSAIPIDQVRIIPIRTN